MEYIIVQNAVEKEERIDKPQSIDNNISIITIIRIVEAENKNEAIGKFIINTADVKCKYRLDVCECTPYKDFIKIK